MKTYRCKLIYKGRVKENFLREGTSKNDVLEGLQMFNYGKGHWVIE